MFSCHLQQGYGSRYGCFSRVGSGSWSGLSLPGSSNLPWSIPDNISMILPFMCKEKTSKMSFLGRNEVGLLFWWADSYPFFLPAEPGPGSGFGSRSTPPRSALLPQGFQYNFFKPNTNLCLNKNAPGYLSSNEEIICEAVRLRTMDEKCGVVLGYLIRWLFI